MRKARRLTPCVFSEISKIDKNRGRRSRITEETQSIQSCCHQRRIRIIKPHSANRITHDRGCENAGRAVYKFTMKTERAQELVANKQTGGSKRNGGCETDWK